MDSIDCRNAFPLTFFIPLCKNMWTPDSYLNEDYWQLPRMFRETWICFHSLHCHGFAVLPFLRQWAGSCVSKIPVKINPLALIVNAIA